VAAGILWLRMPLPFALDHINLWLIEDVDGWTVVDTGVSDRQTRDLWRQVFAGPMAGRPLKRLIVTHFHPDHMGLAAWLTRQFGLLMECPLSEWLYGRMLSTDTGVSFVEASTAFYRAAGFDAERLALVARRGNAYGARVKHVPASCRRIREGDRLTIGGREWQILIGQGHAPELACLWCEELNLLISSDQILPSISPNVSIWPTEPEADQLTLFLASLEKFRRLASDCLVLPSHGLPFIGLHERADGLRRHHDERLAVALDACRRPVTAWDLVSVMFRRRLDDHQLFFAIGESLAHLHCLVTRGQVQRDIDGEGVHWFRQVR
jgi:glyoxylase-like metal-dependent hydrolase (beta-lactamase superfamily II)